jgi:hypothetical protein
MVNRYFLVKTFIFFFTLIGLFSSWLVHYFDPYTIVNPETNLGEKHFHSTLFLSPLYVTLYTDGIFISQEWLPSYWTTISALFILLSATTGIFSQKTDYSLYIILLSGFAGIVIFFLSLSAPNIGWKNFLTPGFWITFISLMSFAFLSFYEISKKGIPWIMNNK